MFIVFEGIDKSGKSTRVETIYKLLISNGYKAKIFKFPSRSKIGNCINKKIESGLKSPNDHRDLQYLCLIDAAFTLHKLENDLGCYDFIISDRYPYSSIVYNNLNPDPIDEDIIKKIISMFPEPDILFNCTERFSNDELNVLDSKSNTEILKKFYAKYFLDYKQTHSLTNETPEDVYETIINYYVMNPSYQNLNHQ